MWLTNFLEQLVSHGHTQGFFVTIYSGRGEILMRPSRRNAVIISLALAQVLLVVLLFLSPAARSALLPSRRSRQALSSLSGGRFDDTYGSVAGVDGSGAGTGDGVKLTLRYTVCSGLINQHYSHIAALILAKALNAEVRQRLVERNCRSNLSCAAGDCRSPGLAV